MPIWKLQTAIWFDSVLSRDAMTIDPVFASPLLDDPQSICDDLAAAIHTWLNNTCQITVKAYDAQGSKPVYPRGEATLNVGASPVSQCPREVALCLSFYSHRNMPRHRGRVYVPGPAITAGPARRPAQSAIDKTAALAAIFSDLGGVDVDWSVYSASDDDSYPVTNWWVDDEWDTMRSRGLRSTTRTMGTTSED